MVVSAGSTAASIELIGAYSQGEFSLASGINGTVKITDPTVVDGGSVAPGPAGHLPAARHQSARHRLRRADDARLRRKQHGRWRHADGDR
jgi:hypothetical protein